MPARGLVAAAGNVAYCVPLTTTQYIRAYYPTREEDDPARRIFLQQMVLEPWPSEYQGSSNTQRGDQASQAGTANNPNTASTDPPSAVHGISSLAELALKPSIDHALETGNMQDIEQLLWLPVKAEAIMSILKAYNPFPGAALPLPAQVLDHLGLRRNVDHADLLP
ncbi:hypothetical protein DXG01_012733, partial [Tephrocybe rancida]